MTIEKLEPCPFCGGDNIGIIPADIILGTQYWRIYCYGCGCTQTPTSNKEDAVDTWNKRANFWHTGTPSEEGDYLLIIKAPKGVPHHFANQLNSKGKWRYVYRGNIIAWQKIQPYKKKDAMELFSAERDRVLQTRLHAKEDFVRRWLISQGWDGKDMKQARKLADGWVVCEHLGKGEITFTIEKEKEDGRHEK